jgi:hypothetical protein
MKVPGIPAWRRWVPEERTRTLLCWCIPALLAGAALRLAILSYLPFATVRPDSDSYLSFAYRFLLDGDMSLNEKRRYVYPIALLPLSALPGSPLRWIAWAQHALGLLSVLPLAYAIRGITSAWRVWVVPVTVFWALLPMGAWYEHEAIADAPFAALLVFAIAGWIRWVHSGRSAAAWWGFFVPFALCVLTKPAGKFLWPALAVAFVAARGWRGFRWPHWATLVGTLTLSAIQGDPFMASRHLCMTAFPYLRLDTPAHAALKGEIRPMVEPLREGLPVYYMEDDGPFQFLGKGGRRAEGYPEWQALIRDEPRATRVFRELGREAVLARPDLFLYVAAQRVLGSANPSYFAEELFRPEYTVREMRASFAYAERDPAKAARVIPFLFGDPPGDGVPDLDALERRMAPSPDAPVAASLQRFAAGFHRSADLLSGQRTAGGQSQPMSRLLPPTALGWSILAGATLSLLLRRYRRTIGVWVAVAACYLFGVYAIASAYPRFFLPVWPILLLALCVLGETAFAAVQLIRRRVASEAGPQPDAVAARSAENIPRG